MRRLLFAATAVIIAAPGNCSEKSKVYNECLKAADYKGCVEVLTQGPRKADAETSAIERLRAALKVLPSRVENTNLRDFYANIQQFTDSLALVDGSTLKKDSDRELYNGALKIRSMLDALQSAWSIRINNGTRYSSGSKYFAGSTYYSCGYLKLGVDRFNNAAGRVAINYNGTPQRGPFGGDMGFDNCSPQEYQMISVINSDIAILLIDPEFVKTQNAKKAKEAELAKNEKWNKHLELNPKLKAWTKANPAGSKVVRSKWEEEESKKSQNSDKSQNSRWSELIWGAQ